MKRPQLSRQLVFVGMLLAGCLLVGSLAAQAPAAPPAAPASPETKIDSGATAWMLASSQHSNTLFEGVPALVILATVLMLPGAGIESLVWATVGGFAVHGVSLAIALARRGALEPPRVSFTSTEWPLFWRGFGVMFAGQALISWVGIIDQLFAAHLGTGAIATLGYANRILALILGLGATAVSRATLPVFARAHAQGNPQLGHLVKFWALLLFLLGVVAMVLGWWLGPWAIKWLFERGAFTAADTAVVAQVFRFGLAQLPFYFAALVLVSVASSQGQFRLLFWTGVIAVALKSFANAILVPLLGVNGLALAWVVVYAANALFLWHRLRRPQ